MGRVGPTRGWEGCLEECMLAGSRQGEQEQAKVWRGRELGVGLKAAGALCLGTHPESVINPLVRIAVSICCSYEHLPIILPH